MWPHIFACADCIKESGCRVNWPHESSSNYTLTPLLRRDLMELKQTTNSHEEATIKLIMFQLMMNDKGLVRDLHEPINGHHSLHPPISGQNLTRFNE